MLRNSVIPGPDGRRRPGVSLVEVQIAFVVLGFVLAGLAPMVVSQYRQHRRLQARFPAGATYYLVPVDNRWAAKFGARARVQSAVPSPPAASLPSLNSQVVESWTYSAANDSATAVVNTDPTLQ